MKSHHIPIDNKRNCAGTSTEYSKEGIVKWGSDTNHTHINTDHTHLRREGLVRVEFLWFSDSSVIYLVQYVFE